ncbi:MAG: rhomboid family intramembrane serine protease [Firmicutes bacterium]|nr:rhomboid family intramembrane serine protease [Bacillota bacterium]
MPLKDDIKSSTVPIVSYFLIAVNVLTHFYIFTLGAEGNQVILDYAIVPYHLLNTYGPVEILSKLTTTMFLHGGWFHILSNMLYLWIFADNVEDRLGHGRFLIFYLITGYIATLTHVYTMPESTVPMVGASGAIAGVLGGYLVLYPKARVLTLLPIFFFISIVRIPAMIFLGFWFFLQVINQTMVSSSAAQSVAWWAHIGGFLAGVILVKFFVNNKDRVNGSIK